MEGFYDIYKKGKKYKHSNNNKQVSQKIEDKIKKTRDTSRLQKRFGYQRNITIKCKLYLLITKIENNINIIQVL